MKKLLIMTATLVAIVGLASCGKKKEPETPIKVVDNEEVYKEYVGKLDVLAEEEGKRLTEMYAVEDIDQDEVTKQYDESMQNMYSLYLESLDSWNTESESKVQDLIEDYQEDMVNLTAIYFNKSLELKEVDFKFEIKDLKLRDLLESEEANTNIPDEVFNATQKAQTVQGYR